MKKITRDNLEKLLNKKDWGEKGSQEREVALILLCSGFVGSYVSKIHKVLNCPKNILKKTAKLARQNGIWLKNGKVDAEWLGKNGTIAFGCDVAVCLGLLGRVSPQKKG